MGNGLSLISGHALSDLEKMKMCDVGSGSGELEEYLLSVGILPANLHSVDVSQASIERQKRLGINVHKGTIGVLPATERFDIIFLSYFIDYDNNQLATFASAIAHATSGAKIILEGKLPARYFVEQQCQQSSNTITRGRFAFEDADLISQTFTILACKASRTVTLERVVVGKRYVYGRFGFSRLPSYFLVFKVV
ncbi:MAG: methyltransferase domain-containing protein [Minisyncoccia bacterium]